MTEEECLKAIAEGETAYELLLNADPKLKARWQRMCKNMKKYLEDVKKHFPDATYYTASGGFNLLLGESHRDLIGGGEKSQSQLVALLGHGVNIGDGDF